MMLFETEEQQDKFWRTVGIAIGVVILHVLGFLVADYVMPPPPAKAPTKIQHITVSKGQLTKNKQQIKTAKTQAKPQKKVQKPEEKVDLKKLEGQIVDVPPTADNRPPEEAKFLSEHNTRVEKETRARETDKDYKKAANKKAGQNKALTPKGQKNGKKLAESAPQPEIVATPLQQPQNDVKVKTKLASAENGQFAKVTEAPPSKGKSKYPFKLQPTETVPKEQAVGLESGVPELKLFPDQTQLAEMLGSPANNYLPEVEEGDGTFLNSREFKYASFFNRIHRSVSSNWYPKNILDERDPTGNMYGYKDRTTVINVVLNEKGRLIDASIAQPSGVNALDDEALAAFKRAAPFPNPPTALLDSHGRLEFRFGFVVNYDRFSLGRF